MDLPTATCKGQRGSQVLNFNHHSLCCQTLVKRIDNVYSVSQFLRTSSHQCQMIGYAIGVSCDQEPIQSIEVNTQKPTSTGVASFIFTSKQSFNNAPSFSSRDHPTRQWMVLREKRDGKRRLWLHVSIRVFLFSAVAKNTLKSFIEQLHSKHLVGAA